VTPLSCKKKKKGPTNETTRLRSDAVSRAHGQLNTMRVERGAKGSRTGLRRQKGHRQRTKRKKILKNFIQRRPRYTQGGGVYIRSQKKTSQNKTVEIGKERQSSQVREGGLLLTIKNSAIQARGHQDSGCNKEINQDWEGKLLVGETV